MSDEQFVFFLLVALIVFCVFIYKRGYKNGFSWRDYLANREQSEIISRAKRLAEDSVAKDRQELYKNQLAFNLDAQKKIRELQVQELFLNSRDRAFHKGYVEGRDWLASLIAELEAAKIARFEQELRHRGRAPKAQELVRISKEKVRSLTKENLALKYEIAAIKENFPAIEEQEENILDGRPQDDSLSKFEDRVRDYVTKEQYETLSVLQRNQLALDRYKERRLSKREIGRFYERYLGYLWEKDRFNVEYFGIEKGLEDLGRDLVCKFLGKTIIIQAKCWSTSRVIHEKHIYQLFGTTTTYRIEHPEEDVEPHFYTTTSVSQIAREAAKKLGITLHENFPLDKDYPMIKCNVSRTGERIYHLPFDQQYDRTQIVSKDERWVRTVAEAEALGFRRAFRHHF